METLDGVLARLRAFCFPGGEEAARKVCAVKTTQRGEMRTTPEARWMPFTAEETIDARRSRFRWDARFQGGALGVTDAYEDGRGRLVIKLGGVVPVKKMTGPDLDKGELQRYLASVISCPPMVLNHASLEWTAAGPSTLRVRDRDDPTGATIDLEIDADGRPLMCRANRPRLVGKQSAQTPWSGRCSEFREWEGLRVAGRMEVAWHLPEGEFTYFREEVTAFQVISA
ncbi:MAG TPA: DUF6544 family protein [Bryobacteraceae bacterium]|nr:DUF6544 family protein [Bryobacteraceae bacterium]